MELLKDAIANEGAMVALALKNRSTVLEIHVQICPLSECQAHSGIAASCSSPLGTDLSIGRFSKVELSFSKNAFCFQTMQETVSLNGCDLDGYLF